MVCPPQAALNSGANSYLRLDLTAHANPAQRVRAPAQQMLGGSQCNLRPRGAVSRDEIVWLLQGQAAKNGTCGAAGEGARAPTSHPHRPVLEKPLHPRCERLHTCTEEGTATISGAGKD